MRIPRAKEVGHAVSCSVIVGKRCDCAVEEARLLRDLVERIETRLVFRGKIEEGDDLYEEVRDAVRGN